MALPDVITTERLRLRPPRTEDALPVFEGWARDPEATRFVSWRPHDDIELTRAFVAEAMEAWISRRRRIWTIEERASGEVIGQIDAEREGCRSSLGYILSRTHWGQGYMTEAVRAVIEVLLGERHIYRVWAVCDVDNRASARVMDKAGMSFEGRLRRWIVHPNVSDEPRDVFCYAKVR